MMHPATAIFVCLFLPLVLWLILSRMVGNTAREFDLPLPVTQITSTMSTGGGQERYSFFSIFKAYRQSFTSIFIAGIVLLMFSVENNHDTAGVFFGMSSWYSVLFIIWMNWCYEGYLHFRYNLIQIVIYPGRAYAFTITIAVWPIFCFLCGLITLLR